MPNLTGQHLYALLSAGTDHVVEVIDLAKPGLIFMMGLGNTSARCFAVAPDESFIYLPDQITKNVFAYTIGAQSQKSILATLGDDPMDCVLSADGKTLYIAAQTGKLHAINTVTHVVSSLTTGLKSVASVGLSPDGTKLGVTGLAGTPSNLSFCLVDTASFSLITAAPVHLTPAGASDSDMVLTDIGYGLVSQVASGNHLYRFDLANAAGAQTSIVLTGGSGAFDDNQWMTYAGLSSRAYVLRNTSATQARLYDVDPTALPAAASATLVQTPHYARCLALTPSGDALFVSAANSIVNSMTRDALDLYDTQAKAFVPFAYQFVTPGMTAEALIVVAAQCQFALSASGPSIPYTGGVRTINLTTSPTCAWTAVSNYVWIYNVSPASGYGSAIITFTVGLNTSSGPQVGTITVGGQTFTVTQDGPPPPPPLPPASPCVYKVLAQEYILPIEGGVETITVQTAPACHWKATTTSQWITLDSAQGAGNGAVEMTVEDSTPVSPVAYGIPPYRYGLIEIGGQTVTVKQRVRQKPKIPTPLPE